MSSTATGYPVPDKKPRRSFWDFGRVRLLRSVLTRGSRYQTVGLKWHETPYLNVGCGEYPTPGFVNLDYFWRRGVQLCWDVVRGCPAPSGSIKGIYTEHCLEHIPLESCRRVIADFFRMLSPGGIVRIVVPDAELYIRLYQESRTCKVEFPYDNRYTGLTPMMHVNRIFRGHGHQFAYDFETMRRILESAGFTAVGRRTYREGRDPVLLIDTAVRAPESLYVEAVRP
jgi:predicted SAM-dependent methyltransferase